MTNQKMSWAGRVEMDGRLESGRWIGWVAGALVVGAGLTGCGVSSGGVAVATTGAAAAKVALTGTVFGGQQAVSGATIQLYATGVSGYGSASYALFGTPVLTNSQGSFALGNNFTCPTALSQVYLVATGGNSGSGNNPNLALMTALGDCYDLGGVSRVSINELTTVATVYALAPFMGGYTSVGTSTGNAQGLTNGFGSVNLLANVQSGGVPGTLPAGATAPTTELNTLADIIATCVNSEGGTAGDGSPCGILFAAVTPAGETAPTDTVGAALAIAKNPGYNTVNLVPLAAPRSPYQPVLSSATDFTVSINYTGGGFSSPSASAIDGSGNVWVTNAGNNTVSVLTAAGTPVTGTPYSGSGLNVPSAIAIDASGNAWVADKGSSQLTVFTSAGTGSHPAVSGLNGPSGVSIDGQGIVWVTNGAGNSVTAVTTSGTTATGSTTFSGVGGITAPMGLAINPH
jgi:DNA-binding beta-propeller fold protein YncE